MFCPDGRLSPRFIRVHLRLKTSAYDATSDFGSAGHTPLARAADTEIRREAKVVGY